MLDDDEWQRALNLNLFPAIRLDRARLPMMLAQGSGVIVHITSIQSRLPLPDATLAYAAAKAALANSARASRKRSARRVCGSCGCRLAGWKTDAAVGLVNELAAKQGTDYAPPERC
jgi:NAD(P)-dependent dehydrogenase (short-subunit alcohol dehydrogenase family)